jgi:hypothetical protein
MILYTNVEAAWLPVCVSDQWFIDTDARIVYQMRGYRPDILRGLWERG